VAATGDGLIAASNGQMTRSAHRLDPPRCLDHVLVLGETHLRRILARYFSYYHRARTHLSLDKDAPDIRPVELPEAGGIMELPEVGGLHHPYVRQAA